MYILRGVVHPALESVEPLVTHILLSPLLNGRDRWLLPCHSLAISWTIDH